MEETGSRRQELGVRVMPRRKNDFLILDLLERMSEVVDLATIATRQECEFCNNKNDRSACDGCITNEMKKAIEKVNALKLRSRQGSK